MLNKKCKFFPCHKGIEDCRFCYCPIYPCGYEEFGKFIIAHDKKVWDCSDCLIFHKSKVANLLHGTYGEFQLKKSEKRIEEHVSDK